MSPVAVTYDSVVCINHVLPEMRSPVTSVLKAAVVTKPVILGIVFLITLVFVLSVTSLTKLLVSGILFSIAVAFV